MASLDYLVVGGQAELGIPALGTALCSFYATV